MTVLIQSKCYHPPATTILCVVTRNSMIFETKTAACALLVFWFFIINRLTGSIKGQVCVCVCAFGFHMTACWSFFAILTERTNRFEQGWSRRATCGCRRCTRRQRWRGSPSPSLPGYRYLVCVCSPPIYSDAGLQAFRRIYAYLTHQPGSLTRKVTQELFSFFFLLFY